MCTAAAVELCKKTSEIAHQAPVRGPDKEMEHA